MPRTKTMLSPKPGREESLIPRQSKPKSVNEALAGVHKAGGYRGFLGEGNIVKQPDYEVPIENLDAAGRQRKQMITDLLLSVIEPTQLSSKSTPQMDRRSLYNKLKKSSLEILTRFLPARVAELPNERLKSDELSEDEKSEIQFLYMEISP